MLNVQVPNSSAAILFFALLAPVSLWGQAPDIREIIEKSVVANHRNFEAAPDFNYKERDRTPKGSKTYQVTIIDGTPYNRLIAVNGRPLSPDQSAAEQKKQEQVAAKRRAESADERQARIAKYEKERERDNQMMAQLTKAFDFTLAGQHKVRGFSVWALKATPRPGYRPPNMQCQVLPGMQGELWIDQKTYNWVRVTAEVLHPVSIEGFLAQVEPGTRFELENSPVENGIWQATHFSMRSNARVLYMFSHNSQEDDIYFDYQRIGSSGQNAGESSTH